MAEEKLEPGKKYKQNYRYQIKTTTQVESRKSYIKNLRATALYLEENMTDEQFHEMAVKGEPFPQVSTYKMTAVEQLHGETSVHNYEICLIPNYGNEEIILEAVKELGIENSGGTRESGFIGCDVPVILDIQCTEDKRDELQKVLNKIASDSFNIYERCYACMRIID
jgi:hypothetical protein